MIVLSSVLFTGLALAAGPAPVGDREPMSTEDYIRELGADRRPDRLYAARDLRRRVRQDLRDSRRRPGSLRQLEALQNLAVHDEYLAPRCLQLMSEHLELRVPCAEILGMLGTGDAVETIDGILAMEERRWARRRLARARQELEPSTSDSTS